VRSTAKREMERGTQKKEVKARPSGEEERGKGLTECKRVIATTLFQSETGHWEKKLLEKEGAFTWLLSGAGSLAS